MAIYLAGPVAVEAATSPSLGAAATYGVLANTYTNSAAGTTVNGDVGFLVAPTTEPAPVGGHTNYGAGGAYAAAGANQATALSALNAQPCTFDWGAAAVDLFLDTTHGPAGVYGPGVYCTGGAMNISGSLTFSGSGSYIFRAGGALGTTAGISMSLVGGASACDIFWTPHATTLGAGTSFVGTLFDNDAVTSGAGTNILGRILAYNGPVTTATTTINLPTCTPPPATLHVVTQVTNNSGGSAAASSFSLHVKLDGADVAGSPGASAGYAQAFGGDCDANGNITLTSGADMTCTLTNDDRPASVTVIKQVMNDNGRTRLSLISRCLSAARQLPLAQPIPLTHPPHMPSPKPPTLTTFNHSLAIAIRMVT